MAARIERPTRRKTARGKTIQSRTRLSGELPAIYSGLRPRHCIMLVFTPSHAAMR
jgi:hypothetical protein